MCIIAANAAGIPMPNRERIKTMWDGNRDGAGLMYVENGQVRIEKGFMKYKDFTKVLDRLEKRLDLTATRWVFGANSGTSSREVASNRSIPLNISFICCSGVFISTRSASIMFTRFERFVPIR